MSKLAVTMMDVGWGDSILIESEDQGVTQYALVDSNDTTHLRSSYLFLKRFFERQGVSFKNTNHNFEFVLLTHPHADHAVGLARNIREFGAQRFLYSNAQPGDALIAQIVRYQARKGSRLATTQPIDSSINLNSMNFGAVTMKVLWPPPGRIDSDENNNSVVLALTLGNVSFVLTGDATAAVWPGIVSLLPANTRVFQVPHHGGRNGTFDSNGRTPWLTPLSGRNPAVQAMISSHILPHKHPHPTVVTALRGASIEHYRTDLHYHIRFQTDGIDVEVKYSHI